MLAIFESPVKSFADGDRFLWTRSVAYSQRIQGFTDCLTLWRICKHDDVHKGMQWIVDSHQYGRKSTLKKALKPKTHVSMLSDGRRIPRQYALIDSVDMQSLEEHDRAKFQELTPEDWEAVLGVEKEESDEAHGGQGDEATKNYVRGTAKGPERAGQWPKVLTLKILLQRDTKNSVTH